MASPATTATAKLGMNMHAHAAAQVGVEICGALKNVLAIAAGIVEGLDLGHNALAALIAQGCSEIRCAGEWRGVRATATGQIATQGPREG